MAALRVAVLEERLAYSSCQMSEAGVNSARYAVHTHRNQEASSAKKRSKCKACDQLLSTSSATNRCLPPCPPQPCQRLTDGRDPVLT